MANGKIAYNLQLLFLPQCLQINSISTISKMYMAYRLCGVVVEHLSQSWVVAGWVPCRIIAMAFPPRRSALQLRH